MKKTLSLAAMLLFLIFAVAPLTAPTALADESPSLTVDEAGAGAVDEIVEVSVHLSGNAAVDSVEFRVNYDPAALRLLSANTGTLPQENLYGINPEYEGLVRFAAVSAYGWKKEGTLLVLSFRVLSESGSAVTLTEARMSTVDASYQSVFITPVLTDGGVSVAGAEIPAPLVTPSPTETPAPTATPEPTATLTASEIHASVTAEPPVPATAADHGLLLYIAFAAAALMIVILLVILLIRGRKKTEKPSKKAG